MEAGAGVKREPSPAEVLPPQLARRVVVDTTTGCWIWQGPITQKGGRPKTSIVIHGHRETLPYRAALRYHFGDPLPGMIACHICNQKLCIRPDIRRHVRWASSGDNVMDARRSGTHAGEHHRHTLTAADVRAIRAAGPLSPAAREAWAAQLGVGPKAIYKAGAGQTWRHLPAPAKRAA
jgi:hypothetical protein